MQKFVTIPTYLVKELPQDKFYAFVDILSMADENREVHTSIRQLMKRWKWGNTKVVNFIEFLCTQDVCKTETRQKQDTILLINSRFFDSAQDRNKTEARQKQDTKKQENVEIYKRIIEHLNTVCGTNYRHNTESSKKDIRARLNEGYKEEDFYTVIDKKAKEWIGTEQEKYLRPITLFGTKFESYLNQTIIKGKGQTEQMLEQHYSMVDDWVKRKEMEAGNSDV